MALLVHLPLLLGLTGAAPAQAPPATATPASARVAPHPLTVRRQPSIRAPPRGQIAAFTPFAVGEVDPGDPRGCPDGWGHVGPDAWACLTATTPTGAAPPHLPALIRVDVPSPEEDADYRRTGQWPQSDEDRVSMPAVYGRRMGRFSGRVWASLDAWNAGAPPTGRVAPADSLHFYELLPTGRGPVLLREDLTVVPLDDIMLYAVSRFEGVDLDARPPPVGAVPAWPARTGGVPVRDAPASGAEVSWTAGHRQLLWVLPAPEAPRGWLQVADPEARSAVGWVADDGALRRWVPAPPPDDVGDAPWVDVDLTQQVVALREGAHTRFVTLTSTGKRGDETPVGIYRVTDKAIAWDMRSRPDAEEPYFVEAVPWTVHFYPRYALHGAYWHDQFGGVRSHGCVNLTLSDAHRLFDGLPPHLPPGWTVVWESPGEPGAVVRVRRGQEIDVPDRRRPL